MAIKTIGVIGAGTMGNGIAQAFAAKGYDVVMQDIAEPALAKGLAAVSGSMDRLIKKGMLTEDAKKSDLISYLYHHQS
jgi:3-hydroxybutyryl-CoA dehydrogenase